MRVVVIGATGNVGSATVRALATDSEIESVVGVARRLPLEAFALDEPGAAKVTWQRADISTDVLDVVRGADAVVSLAWQIQPSHDELQMARTNVVGTRRVLDAVLTHRVPALVYASSVGAYAPGPKSPVDERWPATGIRSSTYSRHKAEVESMLDAVELLHPDLRITRMRTSLVFQRAAASEIHRLFLGALLPWHLPRFARLVPNSERLAFQATHADDVADAYVSAVKRNLGGAFNIAADPVLTGDVIAKAVGGRAVPLPMYLIRTAMQAGYMARMQPAEAGWLDMAVQTPIMDTRRARDELDWSPVVSSTAALVELLHGIGEGFGIGTAPLQPRSRRWSSARDARHQRT
ncbi:MAG: nad-dependent epimerase/dehydratase [Ilumatobacteraceae bacterium]|nr:nad-dependent epimerase/dehydratase [Ilumatobacteraceae bacterium]